jgi:hypothetical protein
MDRSAWRRSIIDYIRAREGGRGPLSVSDFRVYTAGEVQPAPIAAPDAALIGDAFEELATEGFIERRADGSFSLTDRGSEALDIH